MTERAYIALGSNVGDRERALGFARDAIEALPATHISGESDVEETAPFGPVVQPAFLNQMIAVDTALEPHALLSALLVIERAHGRDRASEVRWGPRTLDCDIVLYGDRTIDTPELTVPHPGLVDRDFWQRELESLHVDVHAATAR